MFNSWADCSFESNVFSESFHETLHESDQTESIDLVLIKNNLLICAQSLQMNYNWINYSIVQYEYSTVFCMINSLGTGMGHLISHTK